jgi:hypothetical protein
MRVIISFTVFIAALGLIVGFAAAGGSGYTESAVQESNYINKTLRNNVPVPQLTTSSERKNVARRAELFNNEDKISYIYLVSYGKVMAFYTVQGKVSSLQSYMTPTEQIVDRFGTPCDYTLDDWCGSTGSHIISAPDIDGTYGENVEGIFFFTTEGAYVEWRGEYMMSDQPLKLATPPELTRVIE